MLAVSSLFKAKQNTNLVVGLEMLTNGLAAVALNVSGEAPKVETLEYFDSAQNTLDEVLAEWVEQHKLQTTACHIVLSKEAYQMLLVEPPEVPEEEWRGAIRWRLKDLISIPPEQAAVEVFPLPDDGTKSKKKMVYVVAAEIEKLKAIIDSVARAGLDLKTIDIPELAIRNLALSAIDNNQFERGIAIARLSRGNGSVYIYRKGNMYFARSFSLNYNAGLMDEVPQETLELELQRSVDYYERQMGQAPPALIYVCGEHISPDKIGATIKARFAMPIKVLSPQDFLNLSESCDADNMHFCVGALGAALRSKESF